MYKEINNERNDYIIILHFFTPQIYPRGTNSSTVALIQYLGKPLGPSLKTWPR